MSTGFYTVRRGDTLTKIAKEHGTTPEQMAKMNHLTNLNLIRVGQKLILPLSPSPSSKTQGWSSSSVRDEVSQLWLTFVDAVSKPIAGLKVIVTGLGKEIEEATDTSGKIPVLPVRNQNTVTVFVEKAGGGRKEIAKFEPTTSAQSVVLRSPKIKVVSTLLPHEENSQKEPPLPTYAPGTIVNTRSPAGHPVKQVALECPNKQNLSLGSNYKYRDILLSARARSGFSPQAIAALLDAEAAHLTRLVEKEVRDKKGKPIIDPATGKPKMRLRREVTDEWDPNSANECSSARGVSQVLDGTWIELAMSKGTFLNTRTREEGWITTAEVNERPGHHNGSKVVPAFKLSDGKFVTKAPLCRTLSAKPYLVGRCKASDQNLQELLDLRFDVECAIHTAVDYGKGNMRELSDQGYKLEKLNDGEKAKIMYLCHHLGSSDARKFIEDIMSDDHAQRLLERQIGEVATDIRVDKCDGDYVKAHREWLSGFIDLKIDITEYMCDKSVAEKVRKLIPLTESIRRKKG